MIMADVRAIMTTTLRSLPHSQLMRSLVANVKTAPYESAFRKEPLPRAPRSRKCYDAASLPELG